MRKHPVGWFYALAFALSWAGWVPIVADSRGAISLPGPAVFPLLLLPAAGPALAAAVVARRVDGEGAVDRLLRPLVEWRDGAPWLTVACLLPALALLAGKALTDVAGLEAPRVPAGGVAATTVVGALVTSLLSNPWEEVGWRGFALPRLQERHGALVATLVVGVMLGLWHLPLFFWVGNPMSERPFLPWFVGTVAVSFVYTWLYNGAKRSLLPVTIFHVVGNTLGVAITGVSVTAMAVVHAAVATALIAIGRRDALR
ncbi:MAG: CPBP family intramembrane metalloprotease [Anaerosomatales bacterium]|nr:CPBP family intramembrane metalloprotease [Coriobacteriia bacterium]MDI6691760.1 CPBP family intramembrane metalloprotease [Anaerosomatales bacterium]MDI6842896.1 CPBP family intramembrane metalloprotease [Anaerosomatales bacterium]